MNDDVLRRRAILLMLTAAVLWSSSGLLVKIIDWRPLSILSARSMIATVVFLIYLRRLNFRWTPLQIAGALGYVGGQVFFISATKLTTAANAIFLTYTSPLYIVLFGYWALGEPPHRADWLSMLAIFAGMLLFFGDRLSFEGFFSTGTRTWSWRFCRTRSWRSWTGIRPAPSTSKSTRKRSWSKWHLSRRSSCVLE